MIIIKEEVDQETHDPGRGSESGPRALQTELNHGPSSVFIIIPFIPLLYEYELASLQMIPNIFKDYQVSCYFHTAHLYILEGHHN